MAATDSKQITAFNTISHDHPHVGRPARLCFLLSSLDISADSKGSAPIKIDSSAYKSSRRVASPSERLKKSLKLESKVPQDTESRAEEGAFHFTKFKNGNPQDTAGAWKCSIAMSCHVMSDRTHALLFFGSRSTASTASTAASNLGAASAAALLRGGSVGELASSDRVGAWGRRRPLS